MIRLHPFQRWCAISLDGVPMGYLTHIHGKTEMHLKKDAPPWLNAVRAAGPWDTIAAATEAVRAADPARQRALPLPLNTGAPML